ncbi:MAG TPA: hypothetical protein VGG99_14435 [Acetobacteraceae bacterium]|jgi:hypothetical protein
MTITSINHNPKNESQYARRRSVWKGSQNQLQATLALLRDTPGVQYFECWDVFGFEREWNVSLIAGRLPPKFLGTGRWVVEEPSQKLLNATPSMLRSDMRTLWLDFVTVLARRVGLSRHSFLNERDQMNQIKWDGHSLLAFAPGTDRFDLVVSKYGSSTKARGHHFYQWQARAGNTSGLVNVDNYEDESV